MNSSGQSRRSDEPCFTNIGTLPNILNELIGTRFKVINAPNLRVALESGPLSTWHWHALTAKGVPIVCLDARHAKAALSMQINKTDKNDAYGLAQIVKAGWYREVAVKSLDSHALRSMLGTRYQLVGMRVSTNATVESLSCAIRK